MSEKSSQTCRTCLKSSTKIVPLTGQVMEPSHRRTYGQLLKELVTLECNADYEHLMPQYLCYLCCRELNNIYAFMKQAQYCNNKLINVISKQLGCLQERTIDLPQNEHGAKIILQNKFKKDYEDCKKMQIMNTDAYCSDETLLRLKYNNATEYKGDNRKIEIIDNYQNSDSKEVDTLSKNTAASLDPEMETKCPICGKNINRNENLDKHLRTQHDVEEDITKLLQKSRSRSWEVFVCKLCSCKYNNKCTYLYHLKEKHSIDETKEYCKQKAKIIKCCSCDYTARNYAALNYHKRSKHGTEEDKFKCKFCAYMCLKKFDLLNHVKNSHKEEIKTLKQEAKNESVQGTTLNTSKLGQIQGGDSPAENKDSSDDDIPLTQKFNKSQAAADEDSEICEDKERFSDEEFIRTILNIKKRQNKSSTTSLARRCDECGNVYKNYRALYAHQRHVHISEDKYSLCPHCGKKYKRKTDLRIHIENAHIAKKSTKVSKQPTGVREKRFMCTECSYVCATITILNIHINRHHTGEKPYKCDICFKSFVVPYDLKIHGYLHTGERPYKCPICSKGFRDNSHMLKHKRIHSSERPYKCKDCSKTFTQSYNLSVHRRTHLKERKLNCEICGKVFENRSLLNIHRINENHHDEVI